MILRSTLLFWIFVSTSTCSPRADDYKGIDIGYRCKHDVECTNGNGGVFSKCHQGINVCICTINHLGEDKCLPDSDKFEGVCRPMSLYTELGYCTLECSPKGTKKWTDRDWYGDILDPFAVYIQDNKTSVCFDPQRALHSVPDRLEIKPSTIPNAGLGAFTNIYIAQGTIMGPYKGIFEPDISQAIISGYSFVLSGWFIDGKDVTMSNWLRYVNTPINAEMENLIVFQYKGQKYIQAFKPIQPGTELLFWYGDMYGQYLNITLFDPPKYYSAKPGYAHGSCRIKDDGLICQHDDNAICADKRCLCIAGTHIRGGKCVLDETLGGLCSGTNGETCTQDPNAECDRGVCVCKKHSSPSNGLCASDESFGGRCRSRDGQTCMNDDNAECVQGLCRCKYGTTGIGKKCLKDERYKGRCEGSNGEKCEGDTHAKCIDNICVCVRYASAVNGTCVLDGELGGICTRRNCQGDNVYCDSKSNTCKCNDTHFPFAGKCVKK